MLKRIALHIRRQAVGYLALVVALSGTAYAANKVTGHDIGPIKQRDSGIVTVQPGDFDQASVPCKKGEVALGFNVGVGPSGVVPARINSISMTKREVLAGLYNDSGEPQTLAVGASCLKK